MIYFKDDAVPVLREHVERDEAKVRKLEALRKKHAVFTDEEDRLVVDLSKIGYERDEGRYFVLMRANGSSMYGFRDLAYTIDKMEKGADVNLWVLGEDHKLYAEQLSLILRAAGKEHHLLQNSPTYKPPSRRPLPVPLMLKQR